MSSKFFYYASSNILKLLLHNIVKKNGKCFSKKPSKPWKDILNCKLIKYLCFRKLLNFFLTFDFSYKTPHGQQQQQQEHKQRQHEQQQYGQQQ